MHCRRWAWIWRRYARRSPTRVRSQRDIAFDKELQKLRFKHELDDKDGKPG